MKRSLVAGLVLLLGASSLAAQERTFTITLPESHWNTVARVMSKAKGDWSWDDVNPVMQAITSQVQQNLQAEFAAKQQAATQAAEIAKLKAEIERLNTAAEPTPPVPIPTPKPEESP